jgi:hypothetical protein
MYGTMTRMLKTTVYLTADLKARLERVASERGQSEADVIRSALEQFTAHERPRPTFPLPGAQGEPIDPDRFDEILGGILEANLAHELGGE